MTPVVIRRFVLILASEAINIVLGLEARNLKVKVGCTCARTAASRVPFTQPLRIGRHLMKSWTPQTRSVRAVVVACTGEHNAYPVLHIRCAGGSEHGH